MSFKDVTNALSEVAAHYHLHKAPLLIEQLRAHLLQLLRAFNEFLRRLFRPTGSSLDSKALSVALQFVIVAAAVVAVVLVVIILVRRLGAYRAQQAGQTSGALRSVVNLSAAGWKAHAAKLAQGQDYRGACRAAYLAQLQKFAESGIAPFAATKTNYEYRYCLSAYPALQAQFKQMAELVELVWFGNKEAEADDYARSLAYLNEIEKTADEEQARGAAR